MQSSSQGECTLKVPPEIILQILEHLPVESKIALALTCRAFYAQFFPTNPAPDRAFLGTLNASTTHNLFTWLEKDNAHLYYCASCSKLHKWHRPHQPPYPRPFGLDHACRDTDGCQCPAGCAGTNEYQDWGPHHGSLHYPTARLLMNRHLHGRDHGPDPASAFNRTSSPPLALYRHRGSIRRNYSREARIIGDELFVHTVTTIRFDDEASSQPLRDMLRVLEDMTAKTVCRHFRDATDVFFADDGLDPEPLVRVVFWRAPFREQTRSCNYCHTDSELEVQVEDYESNNYVYSPGGGRHRRRDDENMTPEKRKAYTVVVRTWCQLGGCRDVNDLKWRQMKTHQGDLRRRFQMCAPGAVRERWEGGRGVWRLWPWRDRGRFVLPCRGDAAAQAGSGTFWGEKVLLWMEKRLGVKMYRTCN